MEYIDLVISTARGTLYARAINGHANLEIERHDAKTIQLTPAQMRMLGAWLINAATEAPREEDPRRG